MLTYRACVACLARLARLARLPCLACLVGSLGSLAVLGFPGLLRLLAVRLARSASLASVACSACLPCAWLARLAPSPRLPCLGLGLGLGLDLGLLECVSTSTSWCWEDAWRRLSDRSHTAHGQRAPCLRTIWIIPLPLDVCASHGPGYPSSRAVRQLAPTLRHAPQTCHSTRRGCIGVLRVAVAVSVLHPFLGAVPN